MAYFDQLLADISIQEPTLYQKDFLLTWEKSPGDIRATLSVAEALKHLYETNRSARLFDSGLSVSIFRDQSTRTRFSFASASNLLGLTVQDFDEKKSQIAHGETVRETANMISFLTEIIGIRDDKFLGAGNAYMREVGRALDDGFEQKVLPQRPGIINLQCDIDHPTQSMADLLHLKSLCGSLEELKGKKLAMSWAYSPSYGKPLSVPQGIIGLMTRFGMNVVLAHPEGYELGAEALTVAKKNANDSGGSFEVVHSMEDAFKDAHYVYPKSWAPYEVMKKRTELLRAGNTDELEGLERQCLATNARFKSWECDEKTMRLTHKGSALYMHCLPADISQESCERGEVAKEVFGQYRLHTYRQAGFKPFVIAAMMLLNRFEDPVGALGQLFFKKKARIGF